MLRRLGEGVIAVFSPSASVRGTVGRGGHPGLSNHLHCASRGFTFFLHCSSKGMTSLACGRRAPPLPRLGCGCASARVRSPRMWAQMALGPQSPQLAAPRPAFWPQHTHRFLALRPVGVPSHAVRRKPLLMAHRTMCDSSSFPPMMQLRMNGIGSPAHVAHGYTHISAGLSAPSPLTARQQARSTYSSAPLFGFSTPLFIRRAEDNFAVRMPAPPPLLRACSALSVPIMR